MTFLQIGSTNALFCSIASVCILVLLYLFTKLLGNFNLPTINLSPVNKLGKLKNMVHYAGNIYLFSLNLNIG